MAERLPVTVDNFEGLLKLAEMYDIPHVRDECQRVACQAEVRGFQILGSEIIEFHNRVIAGNAESAAHCSAPLRPADSARSFLQACFL